MDENKLKNIIEAVLLSVNEPIALEKIQEIFDEREKLTIEELEYIISSLQEDYLTRAFELVHVAGGYQVQTKFEYSYWVSRMQIEKPAKYSRALLETLAIIAYKQPVTRADIEEIRGVAVNSQIIKSLIEREWIRVAGYKDVPGKPAVYTTTKEFLNYFNLNYLSELPALPEVFDALNISNTEKTNEECVIE